ncbi:MAG: DUF4280 domain-containing protein [Chloroflexi bacterium]|nr:DUF4280 domain-containing protein [Chloroflexota bacterium]
MDVAVTGDQMTCSFGVAPSALVAPPMGPPVLFEGKPAAQMQHHVPMMNIMPFGVCNSLANPMTASLTAAALGVLTPAPCIPVTPAPWAPPSPKTMINGQPAINKTCKLMCNWGGVIQFIPIPTPQTQIT